MSITNISTTANTNINTKTDAEINRELQEFKWREESDDRIADYLRSNAANRPSVNGWLKEQHKKHLLERLPQFERDTHAVLDEMYQELRQMKFKMLMLSWMIAGAVIAIVLAALRSAL